jgi:hypothetical protein
VVVSYTLLLPVKLLSWIIIDPKLVVGALSFTPGVYGLILLKLDQSCRTFVWRILQKFGI